MSWQAEKPDGAVRVAFVHYGKSSVRLAQKMMASVRKHMPGVLITQLTDSRSAMVEGVDEVRRVNSHRYPVLMHRHLAQLPVPFFRLDTDMIVQGDLREALESDFDIAITTHGDAKIVGSDFAQMFPYSGAMLAVKARNDEIYNDVHDEFLRSRMDDWMGVVPAINAVAMSGKYVVKDLPGDIWNYTPASEYEVAMMPMVLHYKGLRKAWLFPGEEHVVAEDNARIKAALRQVRVPGVVRRWG